MCCMLHMHSFNPLHTPEGWRERATHDPNFRPSWEGAEALTVIRLMSVYQSKNGPRIWSQEGSHSPQKLLFSYQVPVAPERWIWCCLSPAWQSCRRHPKQTNPHFLWSPSTVPWLLKQVQNLNPLHILLPKLHFVVSISDVSLPPPRPLPGRGLSPE